MRLNIVHPGAEELHYEIRDIAEFGGEIAKTGVEIIWENIGDPVAKGEQVPTWIKQIVENAASQNGAYAYSPTKGLTKTRQFLSQKRSYETGNKLDAENIIFFNGLGDAITKIYTWLNPIARVLGPSPAYPTHSSVEAAHGRSFHLTYQLDPANGWLPDMNDVRNKVKYNPNIGALLIINPDNPTGVVYPKETLKQFVDIAKEFDLFLICDEIYANLVFDGVKHTSLASVADDVPTIIMRGLSKEVPWPGSRCGWIECYNFERDPLFARYIRTVLEAKMIEVCSTTLPQLVLPEILNHKEYPNYLKKRTAHYARRAEQLEDALKNSKAKFAKPRGAFYATVTADKDILAKLTKELSPQNPTAAKVFQTALKAIPTDQTDKRFCYALMAATGLCVVPLSGFNSQVPGFRMTLLEASDQKFARILSILKQTFA